MTIWRGPISSELLGVPVAVRPRPGWQAGLARQAGLRGSGRSIQRRPFRRRPFHRRPFHRRPPHPVNR